MCFMPKAAEAKPPAPPTAPPPVLTQAAPDAARAGGSEAQFNPDGTPIATDDAKKKRAGTKGYRTSGLSIGSRVPDTNSTRNGGLGI